MDDVVAGRNGPHGVASIVMGADKKVSRAFPHQALQLLQEGGGGISMNQVA